MQSSGTLLSITMKQRHGKLLSACTTDLFVWKFEDSGEEKQNQIGPGVAVTVRLQRQEITERFLADPVTKTEGNFI